MNVKIDTIAKNLQLGEGCVWDEKRNAIHYIDINCFKVFTYYIETKKIKTFDIQDYIGCVVLDKENNLIVCARNKIIKLNVETGEKIVICTIEQEPHLRFNDGKCDVNGNLWVGSMPMEITEENKCTGKLYCIKNNKVVATHNGFTIPNGLAWTKDQKTFYHIDTTTHKIFAYDVENEYHITNKREVVHIDEVVGAPDGMCIDENDNLWVAIWGGSRVICFDPRTGEKIDEIIMSDENITCCTFAGENLDVMYVTTAENVDMGGLYKVQINGVRGVIANKYQS